MLQLYKNLLGIVLVLTAAPAFAQQPLSDLQSRVVSQAKAARNFIPFSLDEICKAVDGQKCRDKYAPDEWLSFKKTIEREGKQVEAILFEGTAVDYVKFLNDKEKLLTSKGFSLRDDAVELVTQVLPTDLNQLRDQLLAELRVKAGSAIGSLVRDPIPESECQTIPDLDLKVFEGQPIDVGTVKPLSVDQIIGKMNESQRVLCALGYNMLDGFDLSFIPDPRAFLKDVMERRDQVLNDLGLPKYLSIFKYSEFKKIQEYVDIAKDIEERIKNKQLPSPEELQATLDKLDIRLPGIDSIPNIPNIPSPTPPKRMDLKPKKKKEWPGFSYGDKSVVAVEANASLEINGTEKQQEMIAQGKASGYVFSHEINIIGGYGVAYIGPDKVGIQLKLSALGKDLFPPLDESGGVKWVKENPKAFHWDFEEGTSQTFWIGPIPVSVSAGIFVDMGIGYRVGLETTQLIGQVRPFASAGGYARLGIGIAGILSAGAGADLTVLKLSIPLQGQIGLRFDEVGYPFIGMEINSDLSLEYLSGRIYAYVEFPVPAFALPPWEIKKESLTIFQFPGRQISHKIMNWGMEISRFGVKTSGDLVDQSDREEAESLNQAVLADVRHLELGKYEQSVFDRTQKVFDGVLKDLKSDTNLQPLKKLEELKVVEQSLVQFIDTFEGPAQ